MVLGEEDGGFGFEGGEVAADGAAQVEFFLEPGGEDVAEGDPAFGGNAEVRFQEPGEFSDRFIVKNDGIQLIGGKIGVLEAPLDGMDGEAWVVFLAGESFFLGGGEDRTALDQGRCCVMVEGGDA